MATLAEELQEVSIRQGLLDLAEMVVYTTIYDCYQYGKKNYQKIWPARGGVKNSYTKARNAPPNTINKTRKELEDWIKSDRFSNYLAGVGWDEEAAREILLANLEGRRLEESKKTLDLTDNQRKWRVRSAYGKTETIERKSRRLSVGAVEPRRNRDQTQGSRTGWRRPKT